MAVAGDLSRIDHDTLQRSLDDLDTHQGQVPQLAVIEDVAEPVHAKPGTQPNRFSHRCQFIAPYIRVKARRCGEMTPRLLV